LLGGSMTEQPYMSLGATKCPVIPSSPFILGPNAAMRSTSVSLVS
jgi:hypothetical protein